MRLSAEVTHTSARRIYHENFRHASHLGTSAQRPVFHPPASGYIDRTDFEAEGFRANFQPRREFYDEDKKYCKLCKEKVPDYRQHGMFHVYHSASVALLQSMMNINHHNPAQSPVDIIKSWWPTLRDHKGFFRIRELSAEEQSERKQKLFDLLLFLKRNKIIKHTFSCLVQQGGSAFVPHRSVEFDRLEWIGDNIMKKLFFERIELLGKDTKANYQWLHSFIMGNEPLHDAYDAFSFDQIILDGVSKNARVVLPVSKMKADVVETLLGELQVNIWVTQTDASNDYMIYPVHNHRSIPVHYLLFHAMHETVTVMIMEILYKLVGRAWDFMEKLKKREKTFANFSPTQLRPSSLKATTGEAMRVSHAVYTTETVRKARQHTEPIVLFPFFNLHITAFHGQLSFSRHLLKRHRQVEATSCNGAIIPRVHNTPQNNPHIHPPSSRAVQISLQHSFLPRLLFGPCMMPLWTSSARDSFSGQRISECRTDENLDIPAEHEIDRYHKRISEPWKCKNRRFGTGKFIGDFPSSFASKVQLRERHEIAYKLHSLPRLGCVDHPPCGPISDLQRCDLAFSASVKRKVIV